MEQESLIMFLKKQRLPCLWLILCGMCLPIFPVNQIAGIRCGRGGIGRRAALRSLWGLTPWKFESSRPHQITDVHNGKILYSIGIGWS